MDALPPMTSQPPAWVVPTAEEAEDVDEPPQLRLQQPTPERFQRTAIRRPNAQLSLLTKAIMGLSDDDNRQLTYPALGQGERRRSMASNISVASTADLTSDTGLTSPCRTNTPSPPMPEMIDLLLAAEVPEDKRAPLAGINIPQAAPKLDLPRKRCIQFACAAKPANQEQSHAPCPVAMGRTTSAQEVPRSSCIKFACSPRSASSQNAPLAQPWGSNTKLTPATKQPESPSTPRKSSVLSAAAPTSPRASSMRQLSDKPVIIRPKFLHADFMDLAKDSSQFHEFASDTAREEDWIRQGDATVTTKLTIYDTLTKENRIRRLGAEAEEEAALEDEEAEAAMGEDGDDQDESEGGGEEEDDDDEDDEDGYYTDEETGFADSDNDEDEEDESMVFWTLSHASTVRLNSLTIPARRHSLKDLPSDSSATTDRSARLATTKRIRAHSDAPNLPDSTDFVCGTLDEDRPLEEAYLSCLAARRTGKLRVIPQDIDPSFPASDPDDDDDTYNPVAHDGDVHVWMQGEMEDLHHGQDRSRRRRCSEQASPRRYRSPPPKARVRSPKPLFGRHSPQRTRSPAPKALATPVGSRLGAHVQFQLAGRPNTTHTKSLPRMSALVCPARRERNIKYNHDADVHVRDAIDIVKGLEKKRQRRRESSIKSIAAGPAAARSRSAKPSPVAVHRA